MLDGYIARKMHATSSFGAALDSIGDTVFCAVMLFILLPIIIIPPAVIFCIIGIAVIRIASLAIGYFKYRNLAFLHTYLNKFTGLILFCIPLFYSIVDLHIIYIIPCAVAGTSAAEELIINISSKQLNRDIKGILL